MKKARVLLYDIETAPIIGPSWQIRESDTLWVIQDWYMLCFAWKWLDEKKTQVITLQDFKGYKKNPQSDLELMKKLHELFTEADIVIGHNSDRFDNRKANARFILNGLQPPTPYQTVDTLKLARKHFGFSSNRLDHLGDYLGVGRKIKTDLDLWKRCMAGDPKAFKEMAKYNIQDVKLLEDVYLKLRPWATTHPNMANLEGRPEACPICGKEGFMWAQGIRYTKTGQYRRWQCKDCGAYSSQRKGEKDVAPNFS